MRVHISHAYRKVENTNAIQEYDLVLVMECLLLVVVVGKTALNISTLFFRPSSLCFHFFSDFFVDLLVFCFSYGVPVFLQTSQGVTHFQGPICDPWFCFPLALPKDTICGFYQCLREVVAGGIEVFFNPLPFMSML